MAELEKAGKTTVGFAAERFEGDWKAAARAFGLPDLPYLKFPTTLTGIPPARIEEYVDGRIDEMVTLLTSGGGAQVQQRAHVKETEVLRFEGSDRFDAFLSMNKSYLDRGWGDGHPLLPPTRAAVD